MAQHDSTPSLQRAVDSGNWVAVNDLLDDRHVDKAVIEKSGLLPKLVTNRVISLTLMEDIVGKICSHHVSLNSLDEEGMGVLHRLSMGSETERHDVLFLLLSNGADINLTNIDNDTPLHVAAKYRNLRMMLALLRRGTKGDLANKEKRTVLHIFVDCFPSTNILSQKCVDNIFTLLKKTSLSIDATDCEGNTALHVAVRRGQSLIAEKLLTVGARADVVNADGKTVLHIMATEKHKYSSSFWERIVKCGAKIEIKDLEGNTAFRLASILENWDFLKMFTDIFINETEENQNNYFFNDELRAAVEGRRWNVVKWIVKYSTDINTPDSQGRTLLQTLAQFNSDKNVDDTFCLLVEMGADITVRTRKGENLLQLSVRHNNWLVAERLVRTGFGFCELDSEGRLGLLHRLLEQKATQPTSLLILLCKYAANIVVPTQNGDTLLQLAAKHGNIAVVKYLVRKSSRETLNKFDSEGFSILHRLVQHQYEESRDCSSREPPLLSVVNLLLRKGADPLCQSSTGDTILHLAAKHNHWNIVNHLVELQFDVNLADSEGLFLLHRLVKSQEEDLRCFSCKPIVSYRLFQKFLRKGADPSIRTHSGDHVVHLAARQGKWGLVIHLLEQEKAVVNELDSEGFNIFHRLVQDNVTKHKSLLLKILINKGVNLDITSPHAGSALNMAAKTQQWSFACLLVEIGADLDSKDPDGNTALHIAAKRNNWSFVAYLLKKGAHAKLPDSEGSTILHRCLSAVRNRGGRLHKDCDIAMDLILNSDVDVTIKDPEGNLAIHLAAMNGDMPLVSRLMYTPVNLNLKDSEGFTLLMRALQHPSTECECVKSNKHTLSVINHLLYRGVDPEARSPDGMTAFEMAVQCGNWPAILALLPRCEVKIGDSVSLKGKHYLHELAKRKDICDEKLRSFTKTLLARGLNLNERDCYGHSPLSLAINQRNWNYILVLLQQGTKVNVNVHNQSLLHFIISEHKDIPHAILTRLLDAMQARGVDFNSQDYIGRTILFEYEVFSTVCGRKDLSGSLFRLLVDRGANPLVADRNGHSLLRFALDFNKDLALNFVKFLVGTGITTHQPTLTEAARTCPASSSLLSMPSPTQTAFEVRNVQAFRLLVESGASANRELFELSAQYEAEYVVRHKTKAETRMLDILNHAASQPRSLKSLCRLTVSHALGCGLRRREMILTLPIPPSLQEYILFSDILSEEFVTSEDEAENQNLRLVRNNFGRRILNEQLDFFSPLRRRFSLINCHCQTSCLYHLYYCLSFEDHVFVSDASQPALTSRPAQETFRHRADRAAKCSHPARAKQDVKNFVRVQSLSRPRRFLADRGVPPPHTLSRSPHQRKRVTERNH